jgi:prepilin-type N-terminal cleavage/methylation domain-containing protein
LKLQDGHTLIELLIVTAIISVLAAALPQFYPFKTRAYDADVKANLHNVFLSCKGYWTFTSSINPCVLGTVSGNEYGFVASASHIGSSNVYVIDYRGAITSTSGGGGKSSKDDKSTAKEKKKKK